MASGPGIGMAKWQNRPHFNRIIRHTAKFQSDCVRSISGAVNAISGFMNTDCTEISRNEHNSHNVIQMRVFLCVRSGRCVK